MSKIVTGLCVFLLLVFTPAVRADPIVITSGSVTIVGLSGGPLIRFQARTFWLLHLEVTQETLQIVDLYHSGIQYD